MSKPKNEHEKQSYYKSIKKVDNEPTTNNSLDFNDSNRTEEFLGSNDNLLNKPRPLSFDLRIKNFFKDNWIGGIFSLAIIVVGFIAFNVKIDIVKMDTNITNINDKLSDIKSNYKDIEIKVDSIEKNQIIMNKDFEYQKEKINELKK